MIFAIEMILACLAIYFYKFKVDHLVTFLCLLRFYVVALAEFTFRFKIKDKYFKNGYEMGVNTPYYHNKVKLLIFASAGMTFACSVYIFNQSLRYSGTDFIYDYYWIWFGLVAFLLFFDLFLQRHSQFLKRTKCVQALLVGHQCQSGFSPRFLK